MHQQKPAGKAGGSDRQKLNAPLESDAHLALDRIGVALKVRHGDAMAPAIFGAEIDKRDRAPEQVGVSY